MSGRATSAARQDVAFEIVADLDSGEFWYDDADAWLRWLDRIDAAIREHDAWALLVQRPDTDQVVIDVLAGWRERVKRFNGRRVQMLRLHSGKRSS